MIEWLYYRYVEIESLSTIGRFLDVHSRACLAVRFLRYKLEKVLRAVSSTPVSLSVRKSVSHTFGFPFCQRPWDLTKRQDDIAADMEVHMVAYMEVDKVADMVAKKGTQFGKKKKGTCTTTHYPIWQEEEGQ